MDYILIDVFCPPPLLCLDEVVFLQIQQQDGVLDGGDDEGNALCVRDTSEVRINNLSRILIEVYKHVKNEFPCVLASWMSTGEKKLYGIHLDVSSPP